MFLLGENHIHGHLDARLNLFAITRITKALIEVHFGHPLLLALPQQALESPPLVSRLYVANYV